MSQKKCIQVNIVTPDGVIYTHRATSVNVQTYTGGLTILPNHIPIVTALAIGSVTVKRLDTEGLENYIAVDGGLLEFNDNVCNIIANTAERARNIDVDRAEETKAWAEHEIDEAKAHHDAMRLKRAQLALNKAINRIGVSDKFRG